MTETESKKEIANAYYNIDNGGVSLRSWAEYEDDQLLGVYMALHTSRFGYPETTVKWDVSMDFTDIGTLGDFAKVFDDTLTFALERWKKAERD